MISTPTIESAAPTTRSGLSGVVHDIPPMSLTQANQPFGAADVINSPPPTRINTTATPSTTHSTIRPRMRSGYRDRLTRRFDAVSVRAAPPIGVMRTDDEPATMESIMNKFTPFALALAITAAFALTGCSSTPDTAPAPSAKSTTSAAAQPTKEPAKPADLAGTWKQTNSSAADSYQEAEISGDVITINWVADNGDTKSIYWVGSFTAPAAATTPYQWTSTRDQAATESAMLASTDDTKDFTFQDDTISYTASALGTTTTIKLKKQ